MGGSDGTPLFALILFALGPGAGVAVWWWIQSHYRNRAARYRPEEVVSTKVVDLRASDALVRRLRTRSSGIDGGNELRPEQRARIWRVVETPVEQAPEPHPSAEDLAEPEDGAPQA